jgi:hypothetical protein
MFPTKLLQIVSGLLVLLVACGQAGAQIKLGAVGDSLLDEHFDQSGFGQSLAYSKNALELIIASGQIDAGAIDNWGGTRGSGYEYNWALAGSTTETLIANAQHTNLVAQAATEDIPRAVMVVGSNDLFPYPPTYDGSNPATLGSSYEAIYEGLASTSQIESFATAAVNNVVTAARAIKEGGLQLLVSTAPEYGISTYAKTFYTDAAKRDRVDDVMQVYNAMAIERLTTVVGVPVVDLYTLTKDIWGDHGSENSTFELGGVELNLVGTGGVEYSDVLMGNPYTPTADTVDVFTHDGIHPNSAINGLFANLFMNAFNQQLNTSFTLLSEQQILQQAGPTLGSMYTADTLSTSLGGKTLADYVIPAVRADFNDNGMVDLADYTVWRDSLGASGTGLLADGNGDGQVTPADYEIWRSQYGNTVISTTIDAMADKSGIPEPATQLLACGVLALWMVRRAISGKGSAPLE